jgi:hypothetical protein
MFPPALFLYRPSKIMQRILGPFVAVLALALTPSAHAGCSSAVPASLAAELAGAAPGLRTDVVELAVKASTCAAQEGLVTRRDVLSIIDYSIPSTQPRLFVFDLNNRRLLFRELVAHGKNTGDDIARQFSNEPGSLQTSLGLFVTTETYIGNNGYSLRLQGLERGWNDMAAERAIVMHGASYVSDEAIHALHRLGRSSGCPAVRAEIASDIIDVIRGGSAIFAYYPQTTWLSTSAFLPHQSSAATVAVASSR